MATELTMPALSPTMEKGTLARWLVAEGDEVKAGDVIAEIETDKATMEFEASEDGRVARLLVPEGSEDVPVGAAIALLEAAGAEAAPPARPVEVAEAAEVTSAPAPAPVAVPAAPPLESILPPAPAVPETLLLSPIAARIASARGLDARAIRGTGTGGRILLGDLGLRQPVFVEAPFPPEALPAPASSPQPSPQQEALRATPARSTKLNSMRRTIARRLTESKSTIPHFYLTARCNLDPLLAFRRDLNDKVAPDGVRLSVNDMLIKALALALREVPAAHVHFGAEALHHFDRVAVSMAVAIDGGLVTPVLRDVDELSLFAIARMSQALAAKARSGQLLPEDYEGGTVSISNLGMFGIDGMVPVINPPQALILGAAAGVEQPWKVDGEIRLATIMAATASFDHRAIDGATGAAFLSAFRQLVENPLRLAV